MSSSETPTRSQRSPTKLLRAFSSLKTSLTRPKSGVSSTGPSPVKRRPSEFLKVSSVRELELLEIVGKGSFGEVWRVEHVKTRSVAALKVMHLGSNVDDDMLRQMESEKQIMGLIGEHQHIVSLFSSWKEDDSLLFLMQYVPGGDLFDLIKASRRLPAPRAARYVLQLAQALDFLHSKDIVYRDLKLENVLVNKQTNEVLLTDFGLAKVVPTSERTKTICGTIQYMAPEVLSETPYGRSVDWWCLGIVTYVMLTGRYPFSRGAGELTFDRGAGDRRIMLDRISQGLLVFPHFVSLPAEVAVRKMLQPDPRDRLNTFEQLRALRWFDEVEDTKQHQRGLFSGGSTPALSLSSTTADGISKGQRTVAASNADDSSSISNAAASDDRTSVAAGVDSSSQVGGTSHVGGKAGEGPDITEDDDFFTMLKKHKRRSSVHDEHQPASHSQTSASAPSQDTRSSAGHGVWRRKAASMSPLPLAASLPTSDRSQDSRRVSAAEFAVAEGSVDDFV